MLSPALGTQIAILSISEFGNSDEFKPGLSINDLSKYKNRYAYYDHISDEIERLQKIPDTGKQKITINPGDWVAITKQYVVDHGRSNLLNQYKILTKTVYARDLYTDGDIHEWGYDPQPRVSTRVKK